MPQSFSHRRFLSLCRKETLQIVRDPSSLLISVILPLVMLVIFGYGLNLDANRIRIGLVLEDQGDDARAFASELVGSRYFIVI